MTALRGRVSKARRLQAIIDQRGMGEEVYVSFVPARGWFLMPCEPRYLNDEGDHLGDTFEEARYALDSEAASMPLNRIAGARVMRDELARCASKYTRTASDVYVAVLATWAYEELSYWSGKCERPGRYGRAACRALRILLEPAS